MQLPVNPPILPMLAKRVGELPPGEGWIFEPKWDGFRALIFRDGDEIFIQSRDEKPLNRYFPELIDPLAHTLERRPVGVLGKGEDANLDLTGHEAVPSTRQWSVAIGAGSVPLTRT
jgi:ATP-dependent DNA ligase